MSNMIDSIEFSIWTAEDIRKESVVHVTEKRSFEKSVPVENGLRDPRMGPTRGKCVTCGENKRNCDGHFGHIELSKPVYHISWVTNIVHWLRCICNECGTNLIKNFDTRVHRNRVLSFYSKHVYSKCPSCEKKQPKYTWNRERHVIDKSKQEYPIEEVQNHLKRMDETILTKTGLAHPYDMILTVLPVPPPSVRPTIMQGSTVRGEDDLTYRLIQIMRAGDKLERGIKDERPPHVLSNYREGLQNSVTGYINHEKLGNSKAGSSKREYTSLTARLKTKEGRMRGTLMGKRCDFTGRTVITGDDNLGMHEIGIPISVAKKLTVPVKVTGYNRALLQELLTEKDSPVKFVMRPNGSRVDLSFVNRNTISLDVGWTIERSLMDGDIVLFNRQPSLHKMSIMAHEVRVLPYSTFRMNLSCTTPYNADCK